MKYLIFLSLLLTGCSTVPTNTPYQVTGKGNSFEQAKHDAFTKAIEYKLGVLVVSDREQQNLQLVKNEILTYSGGYITNYSVINSTNQNNYVTVTMNVDVSESKIRDRVLGVGTSVSNINGTQHKTQYSTYIADRQLGDRVYQKILTDFHKHAFIIDQKLHKFMLDKNRNSVLIIPYTLRWNYDYLEALNEILGKLEDGTNGFRKSNPGTITIMAKNPNDYVLGSRNTYKFNDVKRVNDLNDYVTGYNELRIQVTIRDTNQRTVYNKCVESNSINGKKPSFYRTGNDFAIFGNQVDNSEISIIIPYRSDLYQIMQNISRIELSVANVQKCFT